ncbi:ligase-associated DNA damage response exonuclease [Gynurincola endophyticus]|uniref:ligase-associated DNA damage response exonuclease n=1 Tax=Gynurincola endophyticus TaxID=2479004 RepID=UPI000F8DEA29|nr:ligase-associated DNA damage response exonuclease [Gynurincola endophyticus]
MSLLKFHTSGIYCEQGNFFIDPWVPVDYALITHAHSDHARAGSKKYLCHTYTKPLLQYRLGEGIYETTEWNQPLYINGVKVSFHPAGHIIGSSQIRVEYKGEVWVVSGDYKIENDGISGAFEPITCHHFITESTFGLPIYNWLPQQKIFEEIQQWVMQNHSRQQTSVLIAYSLGKAQRLLPCLQQTGLPIYAHGAVYNIHQTLINSGHTLPMIFPITKETSPKEFAGNIIIAPSSALDSPWIRKFTPYSVGICSGWMQVRGHQRRRNADAGFALSDHCDWKGLLQAINATRAEQVYVTHGFQSVFSRYLNEQNIQASEVITNYGNEEDETASIV